MVLLIVKMKFCEVVQNVNHLICEVEEENRTLRECFDKLEFRQAQ